MKKLFAVVKPGGTYSHIFNRHTDNDVLGELQKASDHVATHTTLVQANGAQLQKVHCNREGLGAICMPLFLQL